MPNNRHWSASMLLEWVLSRNIEAVLSMADEYGGWRVDEEAAARIQPSTMDDVSRAHTIDEALPKDGKAREAVRRANLFVIPARQKIFDALRSGAIDGWARPNGSGDIARIEPIQWAGLRFRAMGGHDIALPVDSEGDPLDLPRPLAEYLAGTVPASLTPTVWPDPVFPAERAMSVWSKEEANPDRRPDDWGEMGANTPQGAGAEKSDAALRRTAVERALKMLGQPGRDVRWDIF
jgi:hypothetical protein